MAFNWVKDCINIEDHLIQGLPTLNFIENSLQINAILFQLIYLSVRPEHLSIEWGLHLPAGVNCLAISWLWNSVSFLVLNRNRSLLILEVFWILNLNRLSHYLLLKIKQFFPKLLSAHQRLVVPPLLLKFVHLLCQFLLWLRCQIFLNLLSVFNCK